MARFGYLKSLFALACLLALAFTTNAQSPAPTPRVIAPTAAAASPRVAGEAIMYCAGYIHLEKLPQMPEIVGALEEQEQHTYSNGDVVYLNAGSQQGIKEGQSFQIIRPRGKVEGVHKQKHGFLGNYIQEIGQLRVFKVNQDTSAARITFTCDPALLGDLIAPITDRESPLLRAGVDLDQFAAPSGKQTGRLMMANGNREMVTRNDVVYIDLGGEDKVNPGDYLTIYRPLGTGNITRIDNEENARTRDNGFQSNRFRGGGFSSEGSRTKGGHRNRPITSKEVKDHRPAMPRKIVGEMVVISVDARTATAIITRAVGEVHTGDWVEIQ